MQDYGDDGVQYDTFNDGPASSTPEEDERAYARLTARAKLLGIPVWDPAEFDRIHAAQ